MHAPTALVPSLPAAPSLCSCAHAELLSEDTKAVWSPRLSPDRCRIVYLENDALGPHQQCSRLRMVSNTRRIGRAPMLGLAEGQSCPSLGHSRGGQAETKQNSSCPLSPAVRLVHQANQHSAGDCATADVG